MTSFAFALVLASAVTHASWNFLLKRSAHKVSFLWSMAVVSFAVFVAPAAFLIARDGITPTGIAFGVGTAVLHGAYGLSLARGYQIGDLSVVYPIARGLGTALIPLAAVLLLGESISGWGWFGIALVVFGVLLVPVQSFRPRDLRHPLTNIGGTATLMAVLTGLLITSYSLWDKQALDHLAPVTVNEFSMVGYTLLMPPLVFREGTAALLAEWRERWVSIVAAGVMAPLGYVMVLVALTTSRVSYVAPAREVGIVIGALLGVFLLGEGYGRTRIVGSLFIVAGVLTLGLAP
jgi:drug/metabolite transporter (DMT)-like permease